MRYLKLTVLFTLILVSGCVANYKYHGICQASKGGNYYVCEECKTLEGNKWRISEYTVGRDFKLHFLRVVLEGKRKEKP